MTRRQPAAMLALLGGVAVFSWTAILVRTGGLPPATAAFWRVALAALVLIAVQRWLAVRPGRASPGNALPAAEARRRLAGAGALLGASLACWHWSLASTTVAAATLLLHLSPVFVALFERVVLGRAPSRFFTAGLVIALGGLGMLQAGDLRLEGGEPAGTALGAAAGMLHGGYILLLGRVGRAIPLLTAMTWTACAATPVLFAAALWGRGPLIPSTPGQWAAVLALAGLAQICGHGAVAFAAARLPAASVSLVPVLAVPSAALLAWQMLGEPLGPDRLAAIAVVLAGVCLAASRPGSRPGALPRSQEWAPAHLPAVGGPKAPVSRPSAPACRSPCGP